MFKLCFCVVLILAAFFFIDGEAANNLKRYCGRKLTNFVNGVCSDGCTSELPATFHVEACAVGTTESLTKEACCP